MKIENSKTVFWTTPKKVVLVVILAVLSSWLLGCQRSKEKFVPLPAPTASNGDTDAAYLERLYETYNDQYFGNRLTRTPIIDVENEGPDMADSWCDNQDGTGCHISFDLHYTAAPRTAQSVLLHEMCHIKTWSFYADKKVPPGSDYSRLFHGKEWRGCMLSLDAQGAFREINIDYYYENLK